MLKLRDYNSLPGYLVRKTILNCSKVHVRIHHILSEDKTPYAHNHPFHYISIVLKGGYTEELLVGNEIITKQHKVGSVIIRSSNDYHRIKSIVGPTKTLFLTWKVNKRWSLKKHDTLRIPEHQTPDQNGVYIREVKGKTLYCKFNEFWFIGHPTVAEAEKETRLSIHQCGDFKPLF